MLFHVMISVTTESGMYIQLHMMIYMIITRKLLLSWLMFVDRHVHDQYSYCQRVSG